MSDSDAMVAARRVARRLVGFHSINGAGDLRRKPDSACWVDGSTLGESGRDVLQFATQPDQAPQFAV